MYWWVKHFQVPGENNKIEVPDVPKDGKHWFKAYVRNISSR